MLEDTVDVVSEGYLASSSGWTFTHRPGKPAMLNKAISVAFKAGLHEEQAKLEELETILATVGKTQ